LCQADLLQHRFLHVHKVGSQHHHPRRLRYSCKTARHNQWILMVADVSCSGQVRLVGSFTPTATGFNTTTHEKYSRTAFSAPTPTCSISPSDCVGLYEASSSSSTAFLSAYAAALTNVSLAAYATALTVGDSTTTFGTASMATPPIITINGTAYTATISTGPAYTATVSSTTYVTPASTYTKYILSDSENVKWLLDNKTALLVGYYDHGILPKWTPACNRSIDEASCGACTIYGGEVGRRLGNLAR